MFLRCMGSADIKKIFNGVLEFFSNFFSFLWYGIIRLSRMRERCLGSSLWNIVKC